MNALARRLAADLEDLRELRDRDPALAETIRAALVAELVAMHQPASLSERATEGQS